MPAVSEAAPLRSDLADGPEGGAAVWLRAADGIRLRLGFWPGGDRGTVLLLPGRTEYIEKYGRTAQSLVKRGWSVAALDWRGQGLADRLLPDPMMGHVCEFGDYQHDLDVALAWLHAEGPGRGLSQPLVMMAHSMGGLIGLRGLDRGLPFKAAVFSAPMWGIRMPLWRLPMAAVLSRCRIRLPGDHHYAPNTHGISYLLAAEFQGNLLTGDPEVWTWLKSHVEAEPRFGLGGPSLAWVRTAVREARALMRRPAPPVPAITGVGGGEHIVLPAPIRRRMASWPGGRLDLYPTGRHELPMELPEVRELFLDRATALYDSASR